MRIVRGLVVPVVAAATVMAPAGASAVGASQVACVDSSGEAVAYRGKPAKCTFHARGEGFFGYTQLTVIHMRWRGWGSAHPTASGTVVANMGYRAQVTVRLSQRITCQGHRRYKEVGFRFLQEGRSSRMKVDTCTAGS